MLGQLFHEKVVYIKQQLSYKQHPIKGIIDHFKECFVESNMKLLCIGADSESDKVTTTSKSKLEYVQRSIIRQINLFVDAVI